jgi:hypothetical protein
MRPDRMSRCASASAACGERLLKKGADAQDVNTITAKIEKKRIVTVGIKPNENKMSDGGRERASLGLEVLKSSEM